MLVLEGGTKLVDQRLTLFDLSVALSELTWEPPTPASPSWSLTTLKLSRTLKVSLTSIFSLPSLTSPQRQTHNRQKEQLSKFVCTYDLLTQPLTSLLICNVGQRTTPSVVAFAEDGTRHVGDVAKRQVSLIYFKSGLHACSESGSLRAPEERLAPQTAAFVLSHTLAACHLCQSLFTFSQTISNFLLYFRPYKIQKILCLRQSV